MVDGARVDLTGAIVLLWWLGGILFYGRFYVQWIISELKGRSVIPVIFWYMSAVGSVLLLSYNVYTRQPGAAFGQSFNMIVYARNLILIWKKKGTLTPLRSSLTHIFTIGIVIIALILTGETWLREFKVNQELPRDIARQNWIFLGIWALGQFLFFLRFLIQWVVSELQKESTVPVLFWYLSAVAAILQGISFFQRSDWLNTIGMAATLVVYIRNLALVRRGKLVSE